MSDRKKIAVKSNVARCRTTGPHGEDLGLIKCGIGPQGELCNDCIPRSLSRSWMLPLRTNCSSLPASFSVHRARDAFASKRLSPRSSCPRSAHERDLNTLKKERTQREKKKKFITFSLILGTDRADRSLKAESCHLIINRSSASRYRKNEEKKSEQPVHRVFPYCSSTFRGKNGNAQFELTRGGESSYATEFPW